MSIDSISKFEIKFIIGITHLHSNSGPIQYSFHTFHTSIPSRNVNISPGSTITITKDDIFEKTLTNINGPILVDFYAE